MKRPILERIEAEVAAGRLWRAKEIVRGHLAAEWPGAAVSERYGQLLATLGDRLEAGKFLFLSGVRRPEYQDDIALFLERYARSGPDNLVAQFPKSFRRHPFAEHPPQLKDDLRVLNVGEDNFGERARAVRPRSGWDNVIAVAGGLAILVLLIAGFRQVVLWISRLFG